MAKLAANNPIAQELDLMKLAAGHRADAKIVSARLRRESQWSCVL